MSTSDIEKIPLVIYVPMSSTEPDAGTPAPETPSAFPPFQAAADLTASTTSLASTNTQTRKKAKQRHWIRLIKARRAKSTFGSASAAARDDPSHPYAKYVACPHRLHPTPPNLSTCNICLCGACASKLLPVLRRRDRLRTAAAEDGRG
jgi:hypothetical protein